MFLKKHLGQNFLKDRNILAKEARLLDPKGKTVLEIGPGDGRLTEQLLFAGAKKIIAVEKDPRMAAILSEKFAGKPIEVIEGDFLELKPFKIDRIIGNIPYYISSSIVFRLKDFEFRNAVLMVQDEFAKKMVAKPDAGNYGRLSVTSQLFYDVMYVQKVPSHLFTPEPDVDSAIITIRKKDAAYPANTEDVVRALFQHKNKTVRNALSDAGFEKQKLAGLGDFLKRRPRTLALKEIVEVSKSLE